MNELQLGKCSLQYQLVEAVVGKDLSSVLRKKGMSGAIIDLAIVNANKEEEVLVEMVGRLNCKYRNRP